MYKFFIFSWLRLQDRLRVFPCCYKSPWVAITYHQISRVITNYLTHYLWFFFWRVRLKEQYAFVKKIQKNYKIIVFRCERLLDKVMYHPIFIDDERSPDSSRPCSCHKSTFHNGTYVILFWTYYNILCLIEWQKKWMLIGQQKNIMRT